MRAIRFQGGVIRTTMDLMVFRRRSKGWQNDPPAYIHSRILFGPGIYIDKDFVREHNITHVINCAYDTECPMWFRSEHPFKYKCLNAVDTLEANILDWYATFEKTMLEFLREEGSKNIYVHCQCGVNRSGYLCLAFACKKLNMEFDSAFRQILNQRPCALTNPKYREQVYRFSERK
jgi:hypothetical protein